MPAWLACAWTGYYNVSLSQPLSIIYGLAGKGPAPSIAEMVGASLVVHAPISNWASNSQIKSFLVLFETHFLAIKKTLMSFISLKK